MEFKAKAFDQLTTTELYEIVRSRTEIFLMEQNIICRDFDGVDYHSLHCFLQEDDGKVVAYLRAYIYEDAVRIGRVLTLCHGIGLGKRLMTDSIPVIKEFFNCNKLVIDSQKHAEGFYMGLGFVTVSDEFLEENIPHVRMERIL